MVWLTTCRNHKGEVLSCWSQRIFRVRFCTYVQLGDCERVTSWPFQEEDSTQIVKVSVPTVWLFSSLLTLQDEVYRGRRYATLSHAVPQVAPKLLTLPMGVIIRFC